MKFTHYTNDVDTVVAVTTFRGERYRAVAKCDPRDTFDYEKGEALADARCEVIARNDDVKKEKSLAKLYSEIASEMLDEAAKHQKMAEKAVEKLKVAKEKYDAILEKL